MNRFAIIGVLTLVVVVAVILLSDRSGVEVGTPPEDRELPPAFAPPEEVGVMPAAWNREFPKGDFSILSVVLDEIVASLARDDTPAIDEPAFVPLDEAESGLSETEPVVSYAFNGDARAYPLRILIWHEIVNDVIGGKPVVVTYCPLSNSAVVFDRRLGDAVLDFGTTGRARYSNLVMYDRQTESWWQQFLGEAIAGKLTGARLEMLPARIESVARFRARNPRGLILVPTDPHAQAYGHNPYEYYDRRSRPFGLYEGPDLPEDIAPLARVVVVDGEAWSFALLRQKGRIDTGELVLTWEPGQNSALDSVFVSQGRDVGNVVVQRHVGGGLEDAVYDVSFAFAFNAFYPDGALHVSADQLEQGVE